MKYEVKPNREICYVDDNVCANHSLSYEETTDEEATVFAVYEKESDGCLRWVADFGKKDEAERWAQVMGEQK
jgi:hypothetical protein